MGDVWAVDGPVPMAIKVLRGERDPTALTAEVRAVARLHHPGIVTIYDQGSTDGTSWILMERADDTLGQAPPVTWPEAMDLVRQLLAGLAHAHARGVVHRDLKASNVLRFSLPGGGVRWALTDFGIAHVAGTDARAQSTWGTPSSMAPEQFDGRWSDFGPPTDLYALGCLVWRVVTGSHPWPLTDARSLAAAHRSAPLPPLRPRMAVPDALLQWLEGLLAKAPGDRFQRAADAAWALEGLGPPRPWVSPVPMEAHDDATSTTFDPDAPLGPTPEPAPPRDTRPPCRPAATFEEALQEAPPAALPPAALGLSLVALRGLPTVGRHEERRSLWEHLRASRRDGARTVEIRGDEGTGRHHLARWLGTRADELGAAVALEGGQRLDTLARSALRADGLGPDTLERHLASELRALGLDAAARITLAGLLGLGPAPARPEVVAALTSLLRARGEERGLVVVLDGADRTFRPLLAATRDLPILWILLEPTDLEAEVLALGPLSSGARAGALRRMLPVDDTLAADLLQRAGGHLGYARRLLVRWAADALLEPTGRGYRLRPGVAPPTLPAAFVLPDTALAEAAALAALMGTEVERRVWLDACAPMPDDQAVRVEDLLVEAGAARSRRASWRWVRPDVREALLPDGPAAPLHLRIADALSRLPPTPHNLGRQGRHLALAGRALEADERLLQGAARAHEAGELHESLALLDLVSDPARPQVGWRRAMALVVLGDVDAAEASARAALERAAGPDRAAALRALGAVAARRGDRDAAEGWFRAALAEPDIPAVQRAFALSELTANLLFQGRPQEAVALLDGAPDLASEAALTLGVVRGRALHQVGELARALDVMQQTLALAAERGTHTWQGIVRVDLGLVLRHLGEVDEARRQLYLAIDDFDAVANAGAVATARLSVGGLEALAGSPAAALDLLEVARAGLVAAGNHAMASGAQVAALPALARLGDWARFDQAAAAARDPLPPPIPFVVEVLEVAARQARDAGEEARAVAAEALLAQCRYGEPR